MIEIPYWGAAVLAVLTLLFAAMAILYSHAYCELKELFMVVCDECEIQKQAAVKWKAKYYDLYLLTNGKKHNGENA